LILDNRIGENTFGNSGCLQAESQCPLMKW